VAEQTKRRRPDACRLPYWVVSPNHVMKIGTQPLIPYYRPGDKKLAEAVRAVAHKHHAVPPSDGRHPADVSETRG
jgi:hypothetical protein